MLQAGEKFPDFSLQNQDGTIKTLKDYAGKWLVLYVYPKDATPGCTIQAQGFTETKEKFEQSNISVVGISADDVDSHKDFCNKFSLTIDLLADPKGELLTKAGVGQSDWKGTKYWNRSTFVIDNKGIIAKTYDNVKPEGHEQLLLDDIAKLQTQPVVK